MDFRNWSPVEDVGDVFFDSDSFGDSDSDGRKHVIGYTITFTSLTIMDLVLAGVSAYMLHRLFSYNKVSILGIDSESRFRSKKLFHLVCYRGGVNDDLPFQHNCFLTQLYRPYVSYLF